MKSSFVDLIEFSFLLHPKLHNRACLFDFSHLSVHAKHKALFFCDDSSDMKIR